MQHFNLIAPLNSLGYGQVGLALLRALTEVREVACWPLGGIEAPPEDQKLLQAALARRDTYDPSAPCLRLWHGWDMALFAGRGPRCAYTFYETDRLRPAEVHHLAACDCVCVPSLWAAEVAAACGVPAERIAPARPGVDRTVFRPDVPANTSLLVEAGWRPGDTVFLSAGKWELRKGHDFVVEAFSRAFTPADRAWLVLHCHNPFLSSTEQEEWEEFARDRLGERVILTRGRFPARQDVAALMAACDCGFFPSRGEGWGMESAEMLAMHKHLIATHWAGHTEYLTADNALLIQPDGCEPARDGKWFGDGPGLQPGNWAALGNNALEQAVTHLRAIHRARREGRLGANVCPAAQGMTWENTVTEILSAIEEIA